MATTAIWDVRGWLGKVVIYAENPEKTGNPAFYRNPDMTDRETQGLADVIEYAIGDEKVRENAGVEDDTSVMQYFVTGINCVPSTARDEMIAVKKRYGKDDGIVAFHGYQSFAPGEVTPDAAHQIGIELARRLWGERFQVIVATHLDKSNHLHNHFVLNSVSFKDGYRYNDCTTTYMEMRKASDRLCREYGLSVIDEPKRGKSKQYGEWRAEQEGKPTWRGIIKKDVDEAIAQAMTDKQFFFNLRQKGYVIKIGKDITLRPQGKERGLKLARNFGENYTFENIYQRILARTSRPKQITSQPKERATTLHRFKGDLKKIKRIGGLRGLYLYYCFKLGVLPKGRASPAKLHFLLREDLRKLNAITQEIRLLCVNRIDTHEQLLLYKAVVITEIEMLSENRKHLRYQARSIQDESRLAEIKTEIAALSHRLGKLRGEVKSCDGIIARSVEIKEKLSKIRQDEIREKEEQGHEYRRRSGRANR